MSVTDYTSHWFFVEGYGDHRDLHVLTLSFPTRLSSDLLDEAVFDLIQGGSTCFDPLKGFNQLDALDLANYSLLTRLIGRQKFEKRSEEHTSELQSLMRTSYAVFCLKKKNISKLNTTRMHVAIA